jgi:ferrous iron transport protein A
VNFVGSSVPIGANLFSMKAQQTFTARSESTQTKRIIEQLPLSALPIGVKARVVAVCGSSAISRRLVEMGLVPGAMVEIIRAAPFGDPLKIFVRGYYLALRRAEAQTIIVRPETDETTLDTNLI